MKYWESKENLVFEIPRQYPFLKELERLVREKDIRTLLEIGGFPGYYSVWGQRIGVAATLLDFVVHRPLLKRLEQSNGVEEGTVRVIEADLFSLPADPRFDLVLSNGLIEHFHDTEDVLRRHTQFLKPGGVLFVTLPNFRGLNGWFQKKFDRENYDKHNLASMDIKRLTTICRQLELREVDVRYSGYLMLWFENPEKKPLWARALMKSLWFPLKVFFKIFPFNTKAFSPYIVVNGVKPT